MENQDRNRQMWLQQEETRLLRQLVDEERSAAANALLSFSAPASSADESVTNNEHRLSTAGYIRAMNTIFDQLTDEDGESRGS